MGGSLVRALAELSDPPFVAGWSPPPSERAAARRLGVVALAPESWGEAVEGADLVVLATPLEATCALLPQVAAVAPAEATLTDLASLKAPVARAAAAASASERWVGAHPMAGSEDSGFGASSADLYRGARVWLVADAVAAERAERLSALWSALGARPGPIGVEEHDRLMALASHLPQLTANVLVGVLADRDVSVDDLGPGGRDMTRLAESSPEMWRDLLAHATPELAAALRALAERSERVAGLVEERGLDALEDMMRRTRWWRRSQ